MEELGSGSGQIITYLDLGSLKTCGSGTLQKIWDKKKIQKIAFFKKIRIGSTAYL
jgi:hypothetical protein